MSFLKIWDLKFLKFFFFLVSLLVFTCSSQGHVSFRILLFTHLLIQYLISIFRILELDLMILCEGLSTVANKHTISDVTLYVVYCSIFFFVFLVVASRTVWDTIKPMLRGFHRKDRQYLQFWKNSEKIWKFQPQGKSRETSNPKSLCVILHGVSKMFLYFKICIYGNKLSFQSCLT